LPLELIFSTLKTALKLNKNKEKNVNILKTNENIKISVASVTFRCSSRNKLLVLNHIEKNIFCSSLDAIFKIGFRQQVWGWVIFPYRYLAVLKFSRISRSPNLIVKRSGSGAKHWA